MAELISQKKQTWPALFLLIFVLLVTGMTVAGYMSYQNYKQQFCRQVEQQLTAVATSKVSELAQWRQERLGDAEILHHSPGFAEKVDYFLRQPSSAEMDGSLPALLKLYQTQGMYDMITLLDLHGRALLAYPPEKTAVAAAVRQRLPEVVQSNRITVVDFYLDETDGRIYLTILTPILRPHSDEPQAVLAMRVDPHTYIYPFLKSWPGPSQTAETLLVRREGNEVLYLNELRFRPDIPLKFRLPLEDVNRLGVKAVLGQTGLAQGLDYRGLPVMGYISPVPETPWFLLTRLNTFEMYAPVQDRLWQTTFLFGVLIFSAAISLVALFRQQQVRFYREKYQAALILQQSEEELRGYIDNAPNGVFVADETGRYLEANPATVRITGYSVEELLQMSIPDLLPPEARSAGLAHFQQVKETGRAVNEIAFRHKDGRIRHWLVDAVKLSANRFLAFVMDITDRVQGEEAVRRSEQKLEIMLQTMIDGMVMVDVTGQIIYCNHAARQILGLDRDVLNRYYFSREWNQLDAQGNPFPPDQLPLAITLREQRSVADVQHQIVASDGEAKWLSVNAAPLFDDAGQLTGAIASFRDITGVKQTEQALKERAAELERFNRLMVGRELRMVELKKEINRLCADLGLPPRYNVTFIEDERLSD